MTILWGTLKISFRFKVLGDGLENVWSGLVHCWEDILRHSPKIQTRPWWTWSDFDEFVMMMLPSTTAASSGLGAGNKSGAGTVRQWGLTGTSHLTPHTTIYIYFLPFIPWYNKIYRHTDIIQHFLGSETDESLMERLRQSLRFKCFW